MIEIRIRIESATNQSTHLTEVPFDQIDAVIPALQEWGVSGAHDKVQHAYGQFVVLEDGAYFEVVVPVTP
jgi:hypothetical protein